MNTLLLALIVSALLLACLACYVVWYARGLQTLRTPAFIGFSDMDVSRTITFVVGDAKIVRVLTPCAAIIETRPWVLPRWVLRERIVDVVEARQ